MPNFSFQMRKLSRISFLAIISAAVVLRSSDNPFAQKGKEPPVSVAEVSERKTATGSVVTLSADVALSRAQTWQDGEGYHVTLPNTPLSSVHHKPSGVKTRQVGRSLELVIPVTPGSTVTLEPHYNTLSLVVNGSIGSGAESGDSENPNQSVRSSNRGRQTAQDSQLSRTSRAHRAGDSVSSEVSRQREDRAPSGTSIDARGWSKSIPVAASVLPIGNQPQSGPKPSTSIPVSTVLSTDLHAQPASPDLAANPGSVPAPIQTVSPSESQDSTDAGFFGGALFSATAVLVFLGIGGIALLIVRKRSASAADDEEEKSKGGETALAIRNTKAPESRREGRRKMSLTGDVPTLYKGMKAGQQLQDAPGTHEKRAMAVVSASPMLFGPYRVDQEVGKLLLGQPHRMDVLSSRATDDRRAIENSLMKPLNANNSNEESRRRARRALEEYGFVARQSASLLMARDAYERVTAATTLGEIGSELALPFVLEALYDDEQVVRTQAVLSLGALKMPSAIGAILDMARRHPEMPSGLLSEALNACSFEMVESDGVFVSKQIDVRSGVGSWTGEITRLDPSARFEDLPEWPDDTDLAEALEGLATTDPEARVAAARALAGFPVQSAVLALSAMASRDPEASVRSAAVTSLGAIDHESVFAPVLVALADESREVSASAARTLNRLNFDRADAYVRIMETSDPETLSSVARSCIKAGIVKQGIERLTSEDRRSAYEAFSLLSLLAKSNETAPIIDAIINNPSLDIRLSAVHLLGLSGQPEVVQQLRQVSEHKGLPGTLRTAILEVVSKIDQTELV